MYSLLGFRTRGVFDISELNITAGDDVAFGTALMRCGGTEANGDKVELDFSLDHLLSQNRRSVDDHA